MVLRINHVWINCSWPVFLYHYIFNATKYSSLLPHWHINTKKLKIAWLMSQGLFGFWPSLPDQGIDIKNHWNCQFVPLHIWSIYCHISTFLSFKCHTFVVKEPIAFEHTQQHFPLSSNDKLYTGLSNCDVNMHWMHCIEWEWHESLPVKAKQMKIN